MKPLALLIVGVLAAPALGELVHLNDGTTLEGDIRRTNDGWVVTSADGKATLVTTAQVKSIELKKSASSPETANQQLASLRRSVANQGDIKQILERYKNFIAQNAQTPAAKDAEQDVAQWQERLDKGMVKAGDQWVTPKQFAELQSKALETANELRPLIADGKLNEALVALNKALAVTPQNPSLLYLRGVILYRQLQLVPARNAFQGVEAVLPDDGATHNNVAVILWKTHAQMPALLEYEKAMIADPQNRMILDNVAEALHALPVERRKNDLTKRVVEHFNEQDTILQKKMARQGLYRWGSQWVTEAEFNRIKDAERAVKEKLAAMQKDADVIQARLAAIPLKIQNDQALLQTYLYQSQGVDPRTGQAYQLPLPPQYAQVQQEIAILQTEQATKQQELVKLRQQYAQEQKNFPAPSFTGMQKAFDVEGMPGGGPAPSSDAPTTAPAVADPRAPAAPPRAAGGFDFAPATQPTGISR